MAFTFNGNTPTDINFNGQSVTTLQINGTTVWQKIFDVLKNWTSSNWTISQSGDVDTSNTISSSYIKLGVCDYVGGVYSTLTAKSATFDITGYKTLTLSVRRSGTTNPYLAIVSSNKNSGNIVSGLPVSSTYTTKTFDVSSYTGQTYIQITCTSEHMNGAEVGYDWSSCDIYINDMKFT